MKTTKKAKVEAQRAEWRRAVEEGRVLKFGNGLAFKSFPTVEALREELAKLEAAGLHAEVAKP